MENKRSREAEPSKLRMFLTSDLLKGLLPIVGLIVIVVVMNILTEGSILKPKRIRLLLSQVYYPMIVCTGVFFVNEQQN